MLSLLGATEGSERGEATGSVIKKQSNDLDNFPTIDIMLVKPESQQQLGLVSTRHGRTSMKTLQQSDCQYTRVGPADRSTTGTDARRNPKVTEIQSHVESGTYQTSTLPTNLPEGFDKDTNTVRGDYGSDSVRSSISDDLADLDILRTRSPIEDKSKLVQHIGSQFLDASGRNIPILQFDPPSPVLYGNTSDFSEMVGGTYGENLDGSTVSSTSSLEIAPMCFPDVAEGQQFSCLFPAEESAMTRRHVLNDLYRLELITKEPGETRHYISSLSNPKGKGISRIASAAQDDLERQQQFDDPRFKRIRAIRSPIKGFVVCALSIVVLFALYRRTWAA